jgi:glycosyltransferase involved in cell wall biosynthesis
MLTIFDLQYKEVPQTVPFVVRLVYNLLTPLVLISNQSLIAISKFTKQQIFKYYPFIDQDKIIVTPLGHSITQKPVPLKSRANYIYTPSASHPHKNLLRLIKAFNLYSQHHPDSSLRLHISGFPGLESKKANRLIKEYKLEEKIKFLGWLPYTQVINQMSNAKLCVFPTLYEGFGLPALESLAVGTPLVASDLPVLREVIKDNAIFVNPLDINSIETALKMGITDTKLISKLVKDGQEIAASFTWDNYAHQVIDIYHKFS